mmetsp:Transcript_12159/g.22369  ORF Transcript_12159/g.22369 Transcript_12159/m.22369 type:complete len:670 (+) Transcript_12159:42-2051(+)
MVAGGGGCFGLITQLLLCIVTASRPPVTLGRLVVAKSQPLHADVDRGGRQSEIEVDLSAGRITGSLAGNSVARFTGIPFASPPTGSRRWLRPVAASPWSATLDCTEQRADRRAWPVQSADPDLGPFETAEDSLHLNIWAPLEQLANKSGVSKGKKSPVLFWIYGGGLVSGSKDYPGYEGTPYAKNGVVFVSPNYRVGALGFLKPRGGDANVGLWDLVQALRWVHSEIHAFGGDAQSITIIGESGGADCAYWLSASPVANQLFKRVIMQSPSTFTLSEAQADEMAEEFATASGLSSPSLELMQELNVSAILDTQTRRTFRRRPATGPGWRFMQQRLPNGSPADLPTTPAGLILLPKDTEASVGMPLPAAVIDGELLPQAPLRAFAAGVARHLEFVIGGNRDEDVWRSASKSHPDVPDAMSYGTKVQAYWNVSRRMEWEVAGMPELVDVSRDKLKGVLAELSSKLMQAYREELVQDIANAQAKTFAQALPECAGHYATPPLPSMAENGAAVAQWLEDHVATDFSFLAAVELISDRLAQPGHAAAVYRYQFQGLGLQHPATHGSELRLMLGEQQGDEPGEAVPAWHTLREHWLASWTSFVLHGDPNIEEMQSQWLQYGSKERPILLWNGACGWLVAPMTSPASPLVRSGLKATALLWEDLWRLEPVTHQALA